MLVVVIATSKLIVDRRFNTDVDPMPICKVGDNTRIMVKGKIMEISAGIGVGDK